MAIDPERLYSLPLKGCTFKEINRLTPTGTSRVPILCLDRRIDVSRSCEYRLPRLYLYNI